MYHRFKFEPDPTSIKHFSRPRKVQAQYSAYIVKQLGVFFCNLYNLVLLLLPYTLTIYADY